MTAAKTRPPAPRTHQQHPRNAKHQAHDHRRHCSAAGTLLRHDYRFWLDLQTQFELRIAEKKSGEHIKDLPGSKDVVRVSPFRL